MNKNQIADLLEALQSTYAAVSACLFFLNDPDSLQMLRAKGWDPGTTVKLGRRDGSQYASLDFWKSIQMAQGKAAFNLSFLGSQLMTIISWVGQELTGQDYFDKSPELEFFRHLRNGISHGNAFHFLGNEPRRPAKFKAFEITRQLEGENVLFEFVAPGDLFDLFDYIKNHLRTMP